MTGWRRDLAAAAMVEAACGLAAAAWINASGNGHQPFAVFIACTLAAAAADMVLVPGCVWVRRRLVFRTICRIAAASCTLGLAVWLAIWSMVPFFALGSLVFGPWTDGGIGDRVQIGIMAVPFLVAGTIAGLGAACAAKVDAQPGLVRARLRSHVAGGIFGVTLVLALAAASAVTDAGPSPEGSAVWRPLLVLTPFVLVVAGGVRHALMARDAVRTGTALAEPGPVLPRALACCGACVTLAAAAAFAPASLFS